MAAKIKNNPETEMNEQTGPDGYDAEVTDTPVDKKYLKEIKKREKRERKEMLRLSGKRNKLSKYIFLTATVVIFAALVCVIGFDALGLRTRYLNGFLQNIPIVKNVVPAENTIEGEYAGWTSQELIGEIERLKYQAEEYVESIEELNKKSDLYVKEIDRLKSFESDQIAFKQRQEEFDQMIIENNKSAYINFFETINPKNAEALYKEAVLENRDVKQLKEYIATYSEMNAKEGAAILEEMMGTDMDLVVLIISNLEADVRASILGKMSPANAASVTKMMAPPPIQATGIVPEPVVLNSQQ